MATLDEILGLISSLSSKDKRKLKNLLEREAAVEIISTEAVNIEERTKAGRFCPHCGGGHVVRNGHRKDGVQYYLCRECG